MSSVPKNPSASYQPESRIDIPPLYAWPPRPLKALRWLFFDLFYPWGFTFITLAFVNWYHQLHHQYFNFNYGNVMSPLDRLFGSWHDGTQESLQLQKSRLRRKRRAT